jgi:hypothetical protein
MKNKKHICSFFFALALCCLMLSPAKAQFVQQGSKLVGTGVVGNAFQGNTVSLSSDGNTAIVGGPNDNGYTGAAWVYTRSGGVWTQQGTKLVGIGAVGSAEQGTSVSLSSDGNTAIVGGITDNSLAGAAWVYTRSGGLWSQQGSKLVGTGAGGSAEQGYSVSLSSDGNTAIVGGPSDNGTAGAAWVFTRTAGIWVQQGNKLVGTGAVGNSQQGYSVSLSSDGNTAIVGGYSDNSSAGTVWVFTRSAGVWTQQGSKLVGTGAVGSSQQGYSVSLSSDGNAAIVGGPNDNSSAGAAWVFTRSGVVWSQQGSKLVGTGAVGNSQQGRSVSLSSDGNTAIVGGSGDNGGAGAVWEFTRNGNVWTQQGNKLVGTGATGVANQGSSVSLSSDGNTAIVGGYNDNNFVGAAWVYSREKPAIGPISDIPHDQGGSVRIKWNKFLFDTAGISPQITSYGIWRKVPTGSSAASYKRIAPPQEMSVLDDTLSQYDFIMSVPAVQIPSYNVVVPTLADSSASGTPYFTYLITAHTANINIYYLSKSDSGYSVDNLSPAPVAGLVAVAHTGPSVGLSWTADVTDPDVAHYDVYRSTTGGFTPNPSLKIGSATSAAFTDASPAGGETNYYRVVTVDVHDNQSTPSAEVNLLVSTTQAYQVADSWNMVSVPLMVSDYTTTVLFPTAISRAFAYEGGYISYTSLKNGSGYWLKFNGGQSVPLTGYLLMLDTIPVNSGWNMIGGLSKAVPTASLVSIPPAIVTSSFYGYSTSYFIADTIMPGKAYWVRVNEGGKLILSSGASANVYSKNRIQIVPISELPPPPPGGITGINEAPEQFALEQNYPNPFNPTTRINYALPVSEHVTLKVYNMLGQDVATLVNEIQDGGYKSVTFDANSLPSGVYTYRLIAGTFTEVKKMILIK